MKEIVVFQFSFYEESLEQEAVNTIWGFEGVIEVLANQREGKITAKGEFDRFEMMSELKKIEETAEIIDVIPFEQEAEPPVNTATTSKYPSSWLGEADSSKPPVRSSTVGQSESVHPRKTNI